MLAKEIMIEQGSNEWLELRKEFIGSSSAPIILGVSKWRTPFQLWQEMLDLAPPQFETAAMKRGKELEPIARERLCNKLGVELKPRTFVRDFMMSSLDGIDKDLKTAVEIKWPNINDHKLALEGKVPEHYYPQIQHQMMTLGLKEIWYSSNFNESHADLLIGYDHEFCEKLFDKEKKFWKHLISFEPPELLDRDYENKDDDMWKTLAHEWKEIINLEKDLEQKKEDIRKKIIDQTQGKNCKGYGIQVSCTHRRGNIDYSAV